jgi:bacteriorhodopsin
MDTYSTQFGGLIQPAITTPQTAAPVKSLDIMKDHLMKNTFYFTYVFLLTTGTITLIEALRTKDPTVRHVMNLETCISIVAAFFYNMFIKKIDEAQEKGVELPYDQINLTRYTDWTITTPIMLFVLCLVLSAEKKRPFYFTSFIVIMALNFGMLAAGYFGETQVIDKKYGFILGFVFFFAMYAYIWSLFMSGKNTFASILSYMLFIVFWSIYGLVYFADEKTKNIVYNGLDLIAKALIGIFFWMYFTGVVKF